MAACQPACACFKCRQAQAVASIQEELDRIKKKFSDARPAPDTPIRLYRYWTPPSVSIWTVASTNSAVPPVVGGPTLSLGSPTIPPLTAVQDSCTGPVSELALGSVFAWRRFRVRYPGVLSGARAVRWETSELRAECLNQFPHGAPDLDCTCGIYAFNKQDVHGSALMNDGQGPCVDTVVECWGTTLIGDKGIRTANARIVAASVDPQSVAAWGAMELFGVGPSPLSGVYEVLMRRYPMIHWYPNHDMMLQKHPLSTILSEDPDGD